MCSVSRSISSGKVSLGMSAKYSVSLRTSCAYRNVMPRSPAPIGSMMIGRPVGQNDSTHPDESFQRHRIANDRIGFLSDFIARQDVVRRVVVARIEIGRAHV